MWWRSVQCSESSGTTWLKSGSSPSWFGSGNLTFIHPFVHNLCTLLYPLYTLCAPSWHKPPCYGALELPDCMCTGQQHSAALWSPRWRLSERERCVRSSSFRTLLQWTTRHWITLLEPLHWTPLHWTLLHWTTSHWTTLLEQHCILHHCNGIWCCALCSALPSA